MSHETVAIILLAVMALFLILISAIQLRALNRMALRIRYLEGTTDLIFQSQEHINKMMIAFMEND